METSKADSHALCGVPSYPRRCNARLALRILSCQRNSSRSSHPPRPIVTTRLPSGSQPPGLSVGAKSPLLPLQRFKRPLLYRTSPALSRGNLKKFLRMRWARWGTPWETPHGVVRRVLAECVGREGGTLGKLHTGWCGSYLRNASVVKGNAWETPHGVVWHVLVECVRHDGERLGSHFHSPTSAFHVCSLLLLPASTPTLPLLLSTPHPPTLPLAFPVETPHLANFTMKSQFFCRFYLKVVFFGKNGLTRSCKEPSSRIDCIS